MEDRVQATSWIYRFHHQSKMMPGVGDEVEVLSVEEAMTLFDSDPMWCDPIYFSMIETNFSVYFSGSGDNTMVVDLVHVRCRQDH